MYCTEEEGNYFRKKKSTRRVLSLLIRSNFMILENKYWKDRTDDLVEEGRNLYVLYVSY